MVKIIRSAIIASPDDAIIDQVGDLLSKNDYSIVTVDAPFDVITKVLRYNFDLIILDIDNIELIDMDSIDIIKQVRPKIPIVVTTEDNRVETIRALTQTGVYYILIKPLNRDKFELLLESLEQYKKIKENLNNKKDK